MVGRLGVAGMASSGKTRQSPTHHGLVPCVCVCPVPCCLCMFLCRPLLASTQVAVKQQVEEAATGHTTAAEGLSGEIARMREAIDKLVVNMEEANVRIVAEQATSKALQERHTAATSLSNQEIMRLESEGEKNAKLGAKASKASKHWEKVAYATVSVRTDHHRPVLDSPNTQRKAAARYAPLHPCPPAHLRGGLNAVD